MRKTIEEFGPLLVFFILNARGAEWLSLPETQSLFVATGGFMVALGVALASTYLRGERPNNMTLASAGFVFIFGSITLFLQDETFIKIKPTLVYCLFAGILTFGLVRGSLLPANADGRHAAAQHRRLDGFDPPLDRLFRFSGRFERSRLAHPVNRSLGQLQSLCDFAANHRLYAFANALAAQAPAGRFRARGKSRNRSRPEK